MRKFLSKTHHHTNPLWRVYRLVKFSKVFKNVIIIEFSKFIPSMVLKRHIYKQLLNINIGNQSSIAYKVMLDIFYPELITIGDNVKVAAGTVVSKDIPDNGFAYGNPMYIKMIRR
ncbi:TPA: acetyltransferase [Staphylococcus aureus]|nr:acetyltransferase [Staphylococcus aureus]HDJ2819081.1 acetyltransferase [Staphylococcus aureus]HDJ2922955.1 acetyltransferase [Staphylococcus aureus]